MILLCSYILGFGKLKDRALDFQNGLNLVFAPNEGGKSTLQRFLTALLYGQLRSDLKVQRRLDSWVEQYKPWRAEEYGGILWCRLSDGREVEIHRFFGKDETRIEIRASTGEEITRQYEQQRNGEVLFGRSHFGIPKELFESIGVIRENRVAEIQGYESIRDRIANLAHSGDEELSIRQSLAKIQEGLDAIGSDRAPTKPYKQTSDLVQTLQSERKALEERRTQLQTWVEDRNRLAGEISGLERELSKVRAALLSARTHEMEEKIRSMEDIQNEISVLRTAIESLGARADFPADRLEELNQLVGSSESTSKHLDEIRTEKEAALDQLGRAESQRQELAAYASFAHGNEAEKITEWFVSYLSISLQKDGIQKTVGRLREESGAIEKRLSGLSPAFLDSQKDWERLAREASDDEQLASQNSVAVSERIAVEKTNLADASKAASNRSILARLALVCAVVVPVLAYFGDFLVSQPAYIGVFAASLLLVILALVMRNASSNSEKVRKNVEQMLNTLKLELENIQDGGRHKRKDLNQAMESSGFQRLDDFLTAAKKTEQDRQRLADIQTRAAESEQHRERLQVQSEEIYTKLKEGLAKAGLSCSPGNLKFQIDLLRANLRRFRELDVHYASCVQNTDSLKSKEADLSEEYGRKLSRIRSLLEQAGVETPEQFREECAKRQKLLELLEKETSRTREFSRLAGNLTLSQWKDQFVELTAQRNLQAADRQAGETTQSEAAGSAPLLPYLPTIGEAEEQEKQIGSRLSAVREEYAGAVERVKQAFQNFRPAYEIDEDLAAAQQNMAGLESNRQALEIALETIEKLSRQQQEVLAPQLNAGVEQRFLRLCGGRYEEVKVDPDFQVWVREADTAELRLADHLSRGTQDQLYFSMRFGIMDLVSNADEPCPAFLDEPFAAYDQVRLREAFEVLIEETKRRQVILFTCREDVLQLAERHSANIIRLE